MNQSERPISFWRRLVGKRRSHGGPDFGDMGTAFGLDAIMPVSGDWQLVNTASAAAAAASSGAALVQERSVPPAAHTLSTSKSS